MSNPTQPLPTLEETLRGDPINDFQPVAYYDKHMDCIRIELRDCSITEERINPILTILLDNYPGPGQEPRAGLMIKGITHFFSRWKMEMEGIVLVTELLNQLIEQLPPDPEYARNIRPIQEVASTIELKLNMKTAEEREMAIA